MNSTSLMILLLSQLLIAKPLPANEEPLVYNHTQANPLDDGLALLQKHCYSCHNPNTKSHDELIAPPLAGVKKHYSNTYPEKEDFIKAMSEFVKSPSGDKSLMKGPVKRFGLMPKPVVPKKDLEKIVEYIYANELENPAWHIEKDNQQKNKTGGQR